jgi:release factor glutamine methyltransferase
VSVDWTILKLVQWTTDYLQKRGIPSARLDSEVLLADTLKLTRVQLYTRHDQPLTADELTAFKARLTRRANREPLAYILGKKEFWALDFEVGPGVLVPRPDTETLVEEGLRLLGGSRRSQPAARKSLPWNQEVESQRQAEQEKAKVESIPVVRDIAQEVSAATADVAAAQTSTSGDASPPDVSTPAQAKSAAENSAPMVLDLCTGSAIIPICLARERGARAIGVDISSEALDYARRNVEKLAPAGQVALLQGDLTAPVPQRFLERFDLLTSNPPYLTTKLVDGLEPEVSRHEPRLALVADEDGLDFYRRIARDANRWLKPGGWCLLEVSDADQGRQVSALLEASGLTETALLKDLSGQVRVVRGRRMP